MTNRYDRDPDEYRFGRRDPLRDDDDRPGQYAQGNRYNDTRQSSQQGSWRDARNERDRYDPDYRRHDPDYRGARDYREGGYGEPRYFSGRDNAPNRDYYASGRDYPSYSNAAYRERGNFGGDSRGDYDRDRIGQRRDRQGPTDYRGLYQEQVWARDPANGDLYGYEYTSRVDPRRFNADDDSRDRWRSEGEQNRRFDIDRGWYAPGTSGYGNRGFQSPYSQSQYGKGPKGYTRSDERIREDVCDRLSDDDEVDARDITVTVQGAEVILEGTVIDRRSKHRAEDIAESVSGVKDVTNHLRARKGFFQELGDKISGDDDAEHHGHRGSGTRNTTVGGGGVPQKTSH